MNRLIVTSVACFAAAISGCGGVNYAKWHAQNGHYTGQVNRSEALNVAVATGLTECHNGKCRPLADVPREKLPASMRDATNLDIYTSLMDAMVVATGVGEMAGVVSPAVNLGLGNLASGLLTISFFLSPSEMAHPATKPTVIAWMPQSMAATPEQAQEVMEDLLYKASPGGTFQGYSIKEGGAHETEVAMMFSGAPSCDGTWACFISMSVWDAPATVKSSPDWLGGYPAYAWLNWQPETDTSDEVHSLDLSYGRWSEEKGESFPPDLNLRAYMLEMSANLPKWVYIYLPPTKAHNFPVMLNEGKMLFFIEPKTSVAHSQTG